MIYKTQYARNMRKEDKQGWGMRVKTVYSSLAAMVILGRRLQNTSDVS